MALRTNDEHMLKLEDDQTLKLLYTPPFTSEGLTHAAKKSETRTAPEFHIIRAFLTPPVPSPVK